MKKIVQKLCLGILALIMVLPLGMKPIITEGAVPDPLVMRYEDDFSGDCDDRISLGTGAVYADGSVSYTSEAGSDLTRAFDVYFNRDKSHVSGNFAVDFKLKRQDNDENTAGIAIMLKGGALERAVDIRWNKYDADSNSQVSVYNASGHQRIMSTSEEELRFTLLYNSVTGKCSLWIDGTEMFVDSTEYVLEANNLNRVSFLALGAVSVSLEEFKYYTVPAEKMTAVKQTLYHEDFENDTYDESHVELFSRNATYTHANGALAQATVGGEANTKFYFNDDKSAVSGEYVVEIELSRPVQTTRYIYDDRCRVYFGNSMYVDWNYQTENLFVRIGNGSGSFNERIATDLTTANCSAKNALKVAVKFNSEEGTASMWINDTVVFSDHTLSSPSLTNISYVMLGCYPECDSRMNMNGNSGDIYVQDVHCYIPEPIPLTDDQIIARAHSRLDESTIMTAPLTENGYLVDDLVLPSKGFYDTDLSWSTDVDGIIDLETGYVTRGAEEANITLTATVSYGNGTPMEKDFEFKIPARGVSVDGVPPMINMVYREDFNEHDANRFDLRNGPDGKVEVVDGVLSMEAYSNATGITRAYVYLNEDKSDVKGNIGIEFTITRPKTSDHIMIWPGGTVNYRYTDIRWFADVVHLYYVDEATGKLVSTPLNVDDYGAQTSLKVTFQIDTDTGVATVLFNNKLAMSNIKIIPGSLGWIDFIKENAKFKVDIDNFRFYQCATDDVRAAQYDADELTYERLIAPNEIVEGVIAYDLELPTKGTRDSQIVWESSHPDVIQPDGTVIRAAEDTEVTLKATVTSGAEVHVKEFKVTVLKSGEGDLVILKADYDTVTLDSILNESPIGEGLITQDLTLNTDAPFGSTISWSTSNSGLIMTDGTVIRPANGDDDIYAILTATITNGDYSLDKTFRLGVVPMSYDFSSAPMPEEYELIYQTDFRRHIPEVDGDGEWNDVDNMNYNIDSWAITRGWNGRITEFDGYVELIRNANVDGRSTVLTYPLRPSTENIGDIAVTEFVLGKEGNGEAQLHVGGSNSGLNALLLWNPDGSFKIRHRDKDGNMIETMTSSYGNRAEITFMTEESSKTFSLWINGENILLRAYPYSIGCTGLLRIQPIIEGTNYITYTISNIRTYKAYPFDHLRPETDYAWLTEDLIRDGIPAPAKGKLNSDLNLITEGKYGSNIVWESSDEQWISTDGTVTRPQNSLQEEQVTLTATISYGEFKSIKEFKFNVMPYYSADESIVEQDEAYLTLDNYDMFSFTDNDPNAVTTSLSLPSSGPYGSTYLWKSSNPEVITTSGRVIRPRWDGDPQTVTLTARIIYGSAIRTKEFVFTVLPDEEIKDPLHMSDEDFFGVWENGVWVNEGKFNYSYDGLSEVEAAVKDGNNYELAKEKLLEYMRNRPRSFLSKGISRQPDYVEAFTVTGVHQNEYAAHFQARPTIRSHEYQEYEINVKSGGSITKGTTMNYKIGARFNEDTAVRIISTEHPDSSMHPRLVLEINGTMRTFYPVGDTVIRGGSNRFRNYSDEEEMEVRFFGEFQGEGTADTLLQFDLTSLGEWDSVTDARLYITAKLEEPYAESKELLVYREGSEWDASTVTMDNFVEYACNYNGVPGENTWYVVKNAESEYLTQSTRFNNQKSAVAEFAYTGDEKYSYAVIWDLMDFIRDTQGRFVFTEQASNVGGSADWEVNPNVVRYGAFPSALSVSEKLQNGVIPVFETLLRSKYMTPDVCAAILKNFWHGSYELEQFLKDPVNQGMGANQKIFEASAFSTVAMFMPEFSCAEARLESGIDVMEQLIKWSIFEDGAYVESTDGYSGQVLTELVTFWDKILRCGLDYSDEIKDILDKTSVYNCLLKAPAGIGIAWGDGGKTGSNLSPRFPKYYELTRDENFQFLSTYGRKGIMPDWTSKLYESTMVAFMRSDWTDNAKFALMSSSGFAGHGHADSNALTVNAFKKSLLIDGGYYNYDSTSPIRRYMISTRAHNTVEVDNTSQNRIAADSTVGITPTAIKHNWTSNSEYDFYSVTTTSNVDVDHRRTVTFVKPDFWIVSDLMTPDDMNEEHNYRQLWHMSSDSNLTHNNANRTIYSDFASGAEIMIASADTDASIVEDIGYDTVAWGVATEAPYGYYFKQNVTGKQTFDTVILPYETTGNVKADHIDLGVPTYDATAMKISTEISGTENTTYYMLDYDHIAGAEHTFDKYKSDAELALTRESSNGVVQEAIINNGKYIKSANGNVILMSKTNASELSFEIKGKTIEVYASEGISPNDVTLYCNSKIDNVYYNGEIIKFEQSGGNVSLKDEKSDIVLENDPSSDRGGIKGNDEDDNPFNGDDSSGGSGSSGGGSAGGNTGDDQDVVTPGIDKPSNFSDISGHWAADSIARMAEMKVVEGYNGEFRPDASISRAELITMVVRALGLSLDGSETDFTDVEYDSWYAPYVKTALENKLISADTMFRPNAQITREEMAKILSCADAMLKGTDSIGKGYTLNYSDSEAVSEWALPYVEYASQYGLMNGVENNCFAPKTTATRAQVATVLDRMFESVKK